MQWDKRSLQIGIGCLVAALLLRIFSGVSFTPLPGIDRLLAAAVFWETGRVVKLSPEQTQPQESQPQTLPAAAILVSDPQLPLTFSQQDLSLLEIQNTAGLTVDPEKMLQQPNTWELTQEGPAVLIVHTHGTESYRDAAGQGTVAGYRSLDEAENMISIGKELARILQEGGIQVIHDTTAYDNPSYSDAYSYCRQAITQHLQENPSIRLVLDLHRDAAEDAAGNQVAYTSQLGEETAAQLMIVMGSDAGGLSYPKWQENLTLAVQLQTALQRRCPGICRPLHFRAQRYNQDLHPGAILVEVGSAGNTHQQAILAVQVLGQGILDMAHGTRFQ